MNPDLEDTSSGYAADRDAAIRWAQQILTTDFVVLDCETTGLDYDDEAVSIGLVGKDGTVLLDTLLCHEKPCNERALAVHGVTWEMTRGGPLFKEIHPLLDWVFSKVQATVIYNVDFDRRIIAQTCSRYGLQNIWRFEYRFECAMEWFAQFYGDWSYAHRSYTWQKLTFAAAHFGLATAGAHGAATDCLLTLGVVKGMAGALLSIEKELT